MANSAHRGRRGLRNARRSWPNGRSSCLVAKSSGLAKMGESILAQTPANKPLGRPLARYRCGRIAHMDEIGVDMQVLSLTSPGVQVFESALATRLAAQSNDALAAAVQAHPTRSPGWPRSRRRIRRPAAREIERAAAHSSCAASSSTPIRWASISTSPSTGRSSRRPRPSICRSIFTRGSLLHRW